METLVITEGTSESAKAIGIRRAKGEVIGILASDNQLLYENFLTEVMDKFPVSDAVYPAYYAALKGDDILNRYFGLIGGNDPLSYYMNKNDRLSWIKTYIPEGPTIMGSIGDNGFFIKKELIERTDLDNYYHIDNAHEAMNGRTLTILNDRQIWHKTGGNIFSFFAKRYRYGLQHAFNKNRRWHLVDFRHPIDIWRLLCFILLTLTVIEPLRLSIRGYFKVRDVAWFLHPVVCLMTLFCYALLVVNLGIGRLSQLLFAPMVAQKA